MRPREFTTEEVRDIFLDHIRVAITDCENAPRHKTVREKLELLAFTILVILDGDSAELPGFIVAPAPYPEDESYRKVEGVNWYPENGDAQRIIRADIGGLLHDHFFKQDKP